MTFFFFSVNARSIVNIADKLELLLLGHDSCVLIITETWLTPDTQDEELLPPG